jgi:peroxiredoxin
MKPPGSSTVLRYSGVFGHHLVGNCPVMIHRRSFLATGLVLPAAAVRLSAEPKVPRPAPELVITLNSGEQVLLSKFRGQPVVLEFLLTTCPHCQRCSSVMQKVWSEMGEKSFQALGTAINPENISQARMMIPEYIYRLGLKFPVGYTQRDMAYGWLQADVNAGPVYFPQLVFIDRKGVVRAQYAGTDNFFQDEEANIRKMVAEIQRDAPAPSLLRPPAKGSK